jgi:GrpB protein
VTRNGVDMVDHGPAWSAMAAAAIAGLAAAPPRNRRLLRDCLRAYPHEAARYARLKKSLAGAHPRDRTPAKTALVQELTDRARARHGLPPVPVREKTG